MDVKDLEKIYLSRPFKTRNADEYDLERILDLFIDPTDGLIGPFDFANVVVKGKMGSGKTMYLRANYAYHLHTLVPCLIEGNPIVLPVYIRLSDFQHLRDPKEIYSSILIQIIKEILSVCRHLQSADELAKLHTGARTLVGTWSTDNELNRIVQELRKMTSEEYVEKVSHSIEAKGGLVGNFLSMCTALGGKVETESRMRRNPEFADVVGVCKSLLEPIDGKLLLLFDEIGSISRGFFRGDENGDSFFETLMNQLRTLSYARTKLAIYPNSSSDILKETRYGDVVSLEFNAVSDSKQYRQYFSKIVSLMERYIDNATGIRCNAEEVFEITTQNQLLVEQLVNASAGNMRRLVHLLDSSMNESYKRHGGVDKVTCADVMSALRKQGADMEALFQSDDIEFILNICKLCKSRSTFRFAYPNKRSTLSRFTSQSEEYNIIEIGQYGTGRKGHSYYFDYAYCVYKDLPTHYVKGTKTIDRTRSIESGEPIRRVAQLSDELLMQSALPGKTDGVVGYINPEKDGGFISAESGESYFFSKDFIIKDDLKKNIYVGCKVRFLPSEIQAGQKPIVSATEIEILE